jgi:hypothetical protein
MIIVRILGAGMSHGDTANFAIAAIHAHAAVEGYRIVGIVCGQFTPRVTPA